MHARQVPRPPTVQTLRSSWLNCWPAPTIWRCCARWSGLALVEFLAELLAGFLAVALLVLIRSEQGLKNVVGAGLGAGIFFAAGESVADQRLAPLM